MAPQNEYHRLIVQPGVSTIADTGTYIDSAGVERAAFSGVYNVFSGENLPLDQYLDIRNAKIGPDKPLFGAYPPDEANDLLAQAQESAFITPFAEIPREEYEDALDAFTPGNFQTIGSVSIFRFQERPHAGFATFYAKAGDKFFCGQNREGAKYDDLIPEILEVADLEPVEVEVDM